LKSYGVLIRKL